MKSKERRAAIVSAAVNLFAEKGFRGTTTRELASAVGVTEPVLYQHFHTKSDLYSAIIEDEAREDTEEVQDLCRYLESDDDRGFLTALARLILGRYEEDPHFIRLLLFSALERHELADVFFKNRVLQFYELVSGYIGRRIREGAFRRMEPNVAARGFIGMISYYGLVEVLFHEQATTQGREELIHEMVTTFLQGALVNEVGSK